MVRLGTLAGVTAGLVVLSGCSGTVALDAPRVDAADAEACSRLVDTLPDRVADQDRVEVDDPARGAAWGDPAVVLTCGVGRPAGYDPTTSCVEFGGVGWYTPDSSYEDPTAPDASGDVVLTSVGRTPAVRLVVPDALRPPTAALADVASAVATLPGDGGCD